MLPRTARHAGQPRQSIEAARPSAGALAAAAAALLLVSACADGPNLGEPGFVEGFAGAAVADEPHASLAGRDILAAGGTAGDAAAAMFFALAVTRPASAGLMTSGYCIGHEPNADVHLAYRFEAPAAVRGLAAVHARFGLLPWRQAVSAGETMARFGARISKAFTEDWRAYPSHGEAAIALYGPAPAVGDRVRNEALAGLLGQIRLNGAGAFYTGSAAQQMWDAMEDAGIGFDKAAWRRAVPEFQPSQRVEFGNHDLAFLPFADSPGPAEAAAWPALEDQGVEGLPGLLRQAGLTWPGTARAETSFAAVDRLGGAVACTLTMGEPFGTGQVVAGVFMPAAGMPSTGAVILSNRPTNVTFGTVTGSGAPGLPPAVMLEVMDDGVPLDGAIARPRALPYADGRTLAEPGARPAGGGQSATGSLGQVNGIICTDGLPNYPLTCAAAADPRGKGFAAIAD